MGKNGEWFDDSSYRQGERGIKEPATWSLETKGGVNITVTRYHGFPPDVWVMHCYDLHIDCLTLDSKDLEMAKGEAVSLVKAKLKRMLDSL